MELLADGTYFDLGGQACDYFCCWHYPDLE